MKIDLMHAFYTASMVILSFSAALVLTKTLSKYINKKKEKKE